MKVTILIFLCFLITSCFKKNENSNGLQLKKDSTQELENKKDTSKVVKDTVTLLLSYEQRQGKYIFMKYCAVCHGDQGKGNGFNSYNLNPRPRSFTDSNYISVYSYARLFEIISKGGRGVNKSQLMPSWNGTLDEDEIDYVVKYVSFLTKQKN